jgi:hypothetical protein
MPIDISAEELLVIQDLFHHQGTIYAPRQLQCPRLFYVLCQWIHPRLCPQASPASLKMHVYAVSGIGFARQSRNFCFGHVCLGYLLLVAKMNQLHLRASRFRISPYFKMHVAAVACSHGLYAYLRRYVELYPPHSGPEETVCLCRLCLWCDWCQIVNRSQKLLDFLSSTVFLVHVSSCKL